MEQITPIQIKKINSIIDKICSKVRPDISILKRVEAAVKNINETIISLGIDADCVKGGSIAKGTFLKNDHDVDLFVRFASRYDDGALADMLEKILSKAFPRVKTSRIHGSRDYYQFTKDKLEFEIIPVMRLHKSNLHEARNITDFSPLHVHWTAGKIEKMPVLAGEIRITKQFCKANQVYGAESYINGFSGHIVDILVIHYGSFLSVVKKFASLSPTEISVKNPLIIDPQNAHTNAIDAINKSKISPLVIVDPVQPERNSAAALGKEKLMMFIDACKNFLTAPSEEYFVIKKFELSKTLRELQIRYPDKKIIIIDVKTLDSSKDIVGTKVFKAYEDLIKQLRLHDFIIIDHRWNFEYSKRSATMIFVCNKEPLSEIMQRAGPPLSSKEDVTRFKQKHQITKIKGNRIFADVKRKYTIAENLLKDLFEEDYILGRVKQIRIDRTTAKKK